MPALPTVSVIICAYTLRRWDDMIASIASAVRQPEATEVIVVIDHSPELLELTQRAWTGLTVVPNAHRQGLSGARNTGLALATGDIVAFLDDDAVAADDWLRRLLDPFADASVVAVGGKAAPAWPAVRAPRAIPAELWWIVGCSYRGLPETRSDVRNVMGCTMALRRAPLVAVGGFNPDTGRIGRHPLGDEETEVCIRLRAVDRTRRIVYEPSSVVNHRVTPDRVTVQYLRSRSFFEGVSKAALSKSVGSGDALSSERSYTLRVLPRAVGRELGAGNFAGAFAIVLSLGAAGVGYIYGSVHRYKAPAALRAVPTEVVS
ncbi:glycosyl transferase family 2 [Glaciihabitans tibetensis]|uniref:Glycosyl transferase family 2 n=1 Tax=Glaciihabitans tibetensis TaxID=1266600 RepID=A0A2T0VJP1_9MICO|nr:glycosyltransferase family 2 protein [Glaciihabitans tibetensis]PRY70409.1 glycosyl transferase family 2 [Glaciihabitans tibetensis]